MLITSGVGPFTVYLLHDQIMFSQIVAFIRSGRFDGDLQYINLLAGAEGHANQIEDNSIINRHQTQEAT